MAKRCALKGSSEAFVFLLLREWQSKDRPHAAEFGVISFSQVLEAVWSRGCTGGSSVALSKLSNKQERPVGRPTRRKSVLLRPFVLSLPFCLKTNKASLDLLLRSCQMEGELLPSELMAGPSEA